MLRATVHPFQTEMQSQTAREVRPFREIATRLRARSKLKKSETPVTNIFLLWIVFFACYSAAFGQGKNGEAISNGNCSVSISGNNNTITIPNCGLKDEQAKQIVDMLRQLLGGQADEKRNAKIASAQKFSMLSDSQMQEIMRSKGPHYIGLSIKGADGSTGIEDSDPCSHTVADVKVEGGKNSTGIKLNPHGPCLDSEDSNQDRSNGRRISCENERTLTEYLSAKPAKINIIYEKDDLESRKFALDWYRTFVDSNWQTVADGPGTQDYKKTPASGIAALIPGPVIGGKCGPLDESTPEGLALNAIYKRSGKIDVSCDTNKVHDYITVFIGPGKYGIPASR